MPEDPYGLFIEDKKFLIGRLIDKGSSGKVYKVIKKDYPKEPLVIKISEDNKNNRAEIQTMKKIKSGIQKLLIAHGQLVLDNVLMVYVVMPRFGNSLDKHIEVHGFPSQRESLSIGLSILA